MSYNKFCFEYKFQKSISFFNLISIIYFPIISREVNNMKSAEKKETVFYSKTLI